MPISSTPSDSRNETVVARWIRLLLRGLAENFCNVFTDEDGHLAEDISESASLLIVITVIWFLVVVVKYNFLVLLSHFTIATMLTIYAVIWTIATYSLGDLLIILIILVRVIDKFQKSVAEICYSRFDCVLNHLIIIAIETTEPVRFIMTISFIYIWSMVGTYFSSANLLYIGFLCIETLHFLDKRRKRQEVQAITQGIL